MIALDNACVLMVVALSAYACVADHPDRKVIQRKGPTMNLTVAEYDQAIADQRKQAAIAAINATEPRPCDWRDTFVLPAHRATTRRTAP